MKRAGTAVRGCACLATFTVAKEVMGHILQEFLGLWNMCNLPAQCTRIGTMAAWNA